MSKKEIIQLSTLDKKILKILLTPDGRVSSKAIAKELGIPATTVQRHRRKLEKAVVSQKYVLDLKKFGWHKVDFLISTEGGKTDFVAKNLLKRDEIVDVGKSIGQHTIDLRVETILEDNSEILRMMELLKATEGVKDAMWTEIVEVVGRKTSIPPQIIDKL